MKKLTVKEEKAAQHYIKEGDKSKAYRHAYDTTRMKDKTINEAACRLFKKCNVAARVEELQKEIQKRLNVTTDSIVDELEEARIHALKDEKGASAAVSASMGKAKVCGLLVDKTELTGKDGAAIEVDDVFAGLSQKDKVRKMQFILRREQEKLKTAEGDTQADGA